MLYKNQRTDIWSQIKKLNENGYKRRNELNIIHYSLIVPGTVLMTIG